MAESSRERHHRRLCVAAVETANRLYSSVKTHGKDGTAVLLQSSAGAADVLFTATPLRLVFVSDTVVGGFKQPIMRRETIYYVLSRAEEFGMSPSYLIDKTCPPAGVMARRAYVYSPVLFIDRLQMLANGYYAEFMPGPSVGWDKLIQEVHDDETPPEEVLRRYPRLLNALPDDFWEPARLPHPYAYDFWGLLVWARTTMLLDGRRPSLEDIRKVVPWINKDESSFLTSREESELGLFDHPPGTEPGIEWNADSIVDRHGRD